jgi:hypothetical protein
MTIERALEMTATIGDYDSGEGARVCMDGLGIRILTGEEHSLPTMDWTVWDAIGAEVERYRRAQAEMAG